MNKQEKIVAPLQPWHQNSVPRHQTQNGQRQPRFLFDSNESAPLLVLEIGFWRLFQHYPACCEASAAVSTSNPDSELGEFDKIEK